MKKVLLNTMAISTFAIVPFAIISCSSKEDIASNEEIASNEDIWKGLDAVKFSMDHDENKIDLTFSIDKKTSEFQDLQNLLAKKSFLTDYGITLENLSLPVFLTDAKPGALFGPQIAANYETRFDDRHSIPTAFDITQKHNYSFLFNVLDNYNDYKVTLSVPKWYLKKLSKFKTYAEKKRKGIVKYFLKIKNVYPNDKVFNKSSKDWAFPQLWDVDESDFTDRAITFWIVEVSYNVNEDTFEVREAVPKEAFDVAWWVGSEGLDSKKA